MRVLFGLCLTLLATAAPAAPFKLSEADTRKAMADFARCAVKARPAVASQAVVEEWGVKELVSKESRLADPDCLRAAGLVVSMRFKADNLRAALAEQLIRRDPSLAPTEAHLAPLAPLNYHQPWPVRAVDDKGRPLKAKEIEAQTEGLNQRIGIIAGQQVAECIVKAKPAGVRSVFATKVASDEERAALSAIAGHLASCVPAGKQMTFDRNSLRGSLALAYYRLAMAAKGVVWAGESPVDQTTGKAVQ